MLQLLAKIIPLDLAATLSPGILALALLVLGSKNGQIKKLLAFLAGILLIGIIITCFGFSLGQASNNGAVENFGEAIVDLFLALIFIVWGIKIIVTKEKSRRLSAQENIKHPILRWFLIGLIIAGTNFDADLLILAAAKEAGDALVNSFEKWLALGINLFFFTLPVTLPLAVYLLFPRAAEPALAKMNLFVLKYSRYIIFVLFMIFGLYLLVRGLKYFI